MNLFFILSAKYLFIVIFLLAAVFFLRQSVEVQIKIVFFGLACAIVSYLIALLAGQLYYDPRPFVAGHFKPLIDHDTENGFPSDHVLLVSVVASVVTVFNKRLAAVLWLLAIIVGVARVYVGVHHSIDIVASMVIVMIVTLVFYRILYKWLSQPLPANNVYNSMIKYGSFIRIGKN